MTIISILFATNFSSNKCLPLIMKDKTISFPVDRLCFC